MDRFPFSVGELLDNVKIEKLSFGGRGLARYKDVVIFVPYSAPGDLLQIKITEIKKRHAEAEIIKIIEPAMARVEPPCPVYGKCGGCDLQHLLYFEQLYQKQKIIKEFLDKAVPYPVSLLPIIECSAPFRYRNRAQLKYLAPDLGFYARNSHDIVDISDCFLLEKELAAQIPVLKQELSLKKIQSQPRIEISILKSGEIQTCIENEEGLLGGEGFSQVNRFQNANLTATLGGWLAPIRFTHYYDLYAGAGNFTFPFLSDWPDVKFTGVEMHPKSVELAQKKIRDQNISPKKCEFYLSDVALFLKRNTFTSESVILVDPPRSGCAEPVIQALANSAAKNLFYISCDPASLSRDLERLIVESKNRWRVVRAQPFDMFPQTHHIETLVQLVAE